jgi:integrase
MLRADRRKTRLTPAPGQVCRIVSAHPRLGRRGRTARGLPRPERGRGERQTRRRAAAPLDPFTLAALRTHIELLERERAEFGPDYQDHGVLFCWENGKPPHPDTITRRFKQLAAAAGLPEIDLHDVRHSYATAGRNAKIDWKALSQRIGHADVAFTMRQYVQTDLETDRQVANTLAELIVGGALISTEITDRTARDGGR